MEMQWIMIEKVYWIIIVDERHVVLEVVENTFDGAVSVLRSERREADVLQCDVRLVPRPIIVLHFHCGQVVLNVVHLQAGMESWGIEYLMETWGIEYWE